MFFDSAEMSQLYIAVLPNDKQFHCIANIWSQGKFQIPTMILSMNLSKAVCVVIPSIRIVFSPFCRLWTLLGLVRLSACWGLCRAKILNW